MGVAVVALGCRHISCKAKPHETLHFISGLVAQKRMVGLQMSRMLKVKLFRGIRMKFYFACCTLWSVHTALNVCTGSLLFHMPSLFDIANRPRKRAWPKFGLALWKAIKTFSRTTVNRTSINGRLCLWNNYPHSFSTSKANQITWNRTKCPKLISIQMSWTPWQLMFFSVLDVFDVLMSWTPWLMWVHFSGITSMAMKLVACCPAFCNRLTLVFERSLLFK